MSLATHGPGDVYKIALYTSRARLSEASSYTPENEVTGPGYTAGGQVMPAGFYVTPDGGLFFPHWVFEMTWPRSSITARRALIYNATKKNRAVNALDFEADVRSTGGNFTIWMPVPMGEPGLVLVNALKARAGIHEPGDVYKVALYTSAATLDKTTTAYSTTNEVRGRGYTAGGQAIPGFSVTAAGSIAVPNRGTTVVWGPCATIRARRALVHNASKAGEAVAVLNFGTEVWSENGPFRVFVNDPPTKEARPVEQPFELGKTGA